MSSRLRRDHFITIVVPDSSERGVLFPEPPCPFAVKSLGTSAGVCHSTVPLVLSALPLRELYPPLATVALADRVRATCSAVFKVLRHEVLKGRNLNGKVKLVSKIT